MKQAILPRRRGAIQALALVVLALLAGCETVGLRDDAGSLEQRAAAQTQAGNHDAAARLYERLAAAASGAERDRWLMAAAESWYFAGERNRALRSMRSARRPWPAPLSAAQTVLAAAVEVDDGEPQAALDRLRALPADPPRIVASDALAVGASAWFALGEPVRALEALIEREVWLDTPSALLANQRRIWEGLRAAGPVEVPPGAGPLVAGWLELGNAVATHAGDPFAERAAMLRWRERHTGHPANDILLRALLAEYGETVRMPQRIAVLLPLSGQLASAGAALRDGLIGGYFDYGDAAEGTEIVFYDTAGAGADTVYRRAVEEGANFVVGPLVKDEVERVANLAAAGPPTLALNYLPEGAPAPGNLYQFALAPEHEATRVAQRAVAEGFYHAIALVPANNWGQRILQAFATELEARGGVLLTREAYDPSATDFSAAIEPALHLDRSHARHRALVAATGRQMEFEPRRRRDVDFIFFAAQATQARLIKPQLRFHYAGDLPVYATAAAYAHDPDRNRDIEGLVFATTPWLLNDRPESQALQATIGRYWSGRVDARNSLYAMGYDAWRLVPLLARGNTSLSLPGLTGQLTLDETGRVRRSPALARVVEGVAAPLAEPGLDDPETGAEAIVPEFSDTTGP